MFSLGKKVLAYTNENGTGRRGIECLRMVMLWEDDASVVDGDDNGRRNEIHREHEER
jgi:hypothetical protein